MNLLFRDKPIYHHDPYISNANSIYIFKKNKFNERGRKYRGSTRAMKACKRNEVINTGSSEVYHLHGVHQHEK